MKKIKLFENFMGDPLEIFVGLADKIEKDLDKNKDYKKADLNKILADADEAALSTKQLAQLAEVLKQRGFKFE